MLCKSEIKTTEYIEQLSSSLFKLQQQNIFCDIVLVSGSTSISCHRIILAATCQYFKDKLLNQQDEIIYLPSWFNENILVSIVSFLYTGSIDQQLFTNFSLFYKIVLYLGIYLDFKKYLPDENLFLTKNEKPIEDIKLENYFIQESNSLNQSQNKNSLKSNKSNKQKKNRLLKTLPNKSAKLKKLKFKKISSNSLYLAGGDIYACNICNESFRFNIGLNRHKRILHSISLKRKLHLHKFDKTLLYFIDTNNNKFTCKICNKSFKYKSVCNSHISKHDEYKKINCYFTSYKYLNSHGKILNKYKYTHIKSHKNEKNKIKHFTCAHCQKSFLNIQKLDKHIINNHGTALLDCHFCTFTTNFDELLKRHEKNKHNKVKCCSLCGKNYNIITKLAIHQYLVHGIKNETLKTKLMKCQMEDCDYECISKKRFKDHALKHSDQKSFSCNMCEKQFKHKIGLEKHKQIIHDRIRPFICEVCGLCFGKDSELRFHIIRHSKEKKFKCEKCTYSTHDKCNLQSHMFRRHKIMSNPRMTIFSCGFCQFVTNCKGNYRDHMKKHTNVLDVPCTQCGKLFATKKNLYGHITKVHRPKSLHCSFCAYSTSLPTTLRDHLRIMHEQRNVKPFECPLCGFRSATRGNCRKHIQRLHNEYTTEPQHVVTSQQTKENVSS